MNMILTCKVHLSPDQSQSCSPGWQKNPNARFATVYPLHVDHALPLQKTIGRTKMEQFYWAKLLPSVGQKPRNFALWERK